MVPVIVFSGGMVIRELSNDGAGTELFYLLFADTCFPMYAYSSFVYEDLISIPFLLLSIWAFLSCMRRFRIWKLVGMGLSIGLAAMFRVNIMIAVFGGFLFSLLWEAKTRYVFPYLLMELPYAAMGINEVIIRLNQRLKKRTIK